MLYAATTLWLMVIVFTAWGIHRIWCSLGPPKVINALLLPGTLVAAVGYIVGLLVSGGTVNNTALIRDDESGEPQTDANPQPRIPVIGPILMAMLPMLACATAIYFATVYLGSSIVARVSAHTVPDTVPLSIAGVWSLLRECITITESLVNAVAASDLRQWPIWLFIYLTICLTVRMGPLPDTTRGAVGAILILGPVSALIGTRTDVGRQFIQSGWPILSFSVATLFFLMLVTLIVRGAVGFVRIFRPQSQS